MLSKIPKDSQLVDNSVDTELTNVHFQSRISILSPPEITGFTEEGIQSSSGSHWIEKVAIRNQAGCPCDQASPCCLFSLPVPFQPLQTSLLPLPTPLHQKDSVNSVWPIGLVFS